MPYLLPDHLRQEYFKLTRTTPEITSPSLIELEHRLKSHNQALAFSTSWAHLVNEPAPSELNVSYFASYLVENGYGLCFHHNITLYAILKDLGFDVKLIAGHFGGLGEISTHAAIVVTIDSCDYLVDAGMGQRVSEILPLPTPDERVKVVGPYSLSLLDDNSYQLKINDASEYVFQNIEVSYDMFAKGVAVVKSPQHLFYDMFLYAIRDDNNEMKRVLFTDHGLKQDIALPETQQSQLLNGLFYNPLLEERMRKSPLLTHISEEEQARRERYNLSFFQRVATQHEFDRRYGIIQLPPSISPTCG